MWRASPWRCGRSNAPHDIEHLAALGVDTIITDTPAEALAIVGRAPLG